MNYRVVMLINKCNVIRQDLRKPNDKHAYCFIKASEIAKISCLWEKESYVMKHDSGIKLQFR